MTPVQSNDSYWRNAYDTLDPDLQVSIGSAKTNRKDVLAAVLQTVHDKRTVCIRKRWRATAPNGKTIVVRDVIDKIARWVKLFIDVGDAAMQYDPGTAALPWAAVRFVLQATINDNQVEASMIANLETVSRMLVRYREFERIHLGREGSPILVQIEEHLTRLYASLLQFLATAVGYYSTKKIARVVKNAVQLPDTATMDRILQQEDQLLKITDLSKTERLFYLEESVTRLADQSHSAQKVLDRDRHRQLVSWVSSVPVERHHRSVSETRMEQSATWIFDRTDYKSWNNSSSSSLLLVHGVLGCGKSKICSAVIDRFLEDQNAHQLAAPFAYFYCKDCSFEPKRSRADEIMRSILRQITGVSSDSQQTAVQEAIASEFDRRQAQSELSDLDLPSLSVQDCVRVVLEVANTDPITIVVDALDEVNNHDRYVLLDALDKIISSSPSVVKVLVTSRNDSQIFALLHDTGSSLAGASSVADSNVWKPYVTSLEVRQDDTAKDMKLFVQREVQQAIKSRELLTFEPSAELVNRLEDDLLAGAAEMFQWINVQLNYLCLSFHREQDIMLELQNRPLALLDDTYKSLLEKLLSPSNPSRSVVIRVFSWLLHMKETLPPEAFICAAFNKSDGTVTDLHKSSLELMAVCSGLVLLDSPCRTYRFSHQSVQDFLRSLDSFSASSSHRLLASDCLSVCKYRPPKDSVETSLYQYAALYWAYHISEATTATGEEARHAIFNDVLSFVYSRLGIPSAGFRSWLQSIAEISDGLPDGHAMKKVSGAMANSLGSPLFLACSFGLTGLLEKIISLIPRNPNFDWDQRNSQGHTGLYLACAYGQTSIVASLLARQADPNIECGRHGNALNAACFGGHTDVIQQLLDAGVSLTEIVEIPTEPTKQQEEKVPGVFRLMSSLSDSSDEASPNGAEALSPLASALRKCFIALREEAALAVITHRSTVLTPDDYQYVLRGSTNSGFIKVIEWLQAADYHSVDRDDMIKLQAADAIEGGQVSFLQDMIRDVPNPKEMLPPGPVALAATYGHGEVVDLLLDRGLSIQEECTLGTPLRCAALMGHETIVRALVSRGADIEDGGRREGSPLHAASSKGHVRIVEFLVGDKTNVHKLYTLESPLNAAALHGHVDVAKALLSAGAVMHVDFPARRQLEKAVKSAEEGDHFDVIKLFLDKGLKAFSGLRFEDRARMRAGYKQPKVAHKNMEFWTLFNVKGRMQDMTYRAALSSTSTGPRGMLGNKRLRLTSTSTSNSTSQQPRQSHRDILEELIGSKVEGSVTAVDLSQDAVFSEFCDDFAGEGCLSYFMDHIGPYYKPFPHFFKVPRMKEPPPPHSPGAVARLLLASMSQNQVRGKTFSGLLQVAAALGDVECIDMLSNAGADVNWPSQQGFGTPLQAAAFYGHTHIVRNLLLKEADPNLQAGFYKTPLTAATAGGHTEIVNILLASGADLSRADPVPRPVFKIQDEITRRSTTIIREAVRSGDKELLATLISAGLDVNKGSAALVEACSFGNLEVIQCLLDHSSGHAINEPAEQELTKDETLTPLFAAIHRGHVGAVQCLIEYGAGRTDEPRWNISSALGFAAGTGRCDVMRVLLDAGADINWLDPSRKTALVHAVQGHHLIAVRELLDAGAATSKDALESAVLLSKPSEILEVLLEAVSEMENAQNIIMGVFKTASTLADTRPLELLAEYMEPDAEALATCCVAGSSVVADTMLNRGAPVDEADSNGYRALDVASRHLKLDVMMFLVTRGATLFTDSQSLGKLFVAAIYTCVEAMVGLVSWMEPADTLFPGPPIQSLKKDRGETSEEDDQGTRAVNNLKLVESSFQYSATLNGKIRHCEKIVQFLSEKGQTDTHQHDLGQTLHLACVLGNMEIIRSILDVSHASPSQKSGYFESPLFGAIYGGHIDVVQLLLTRGCQLSYSHQLLGTPLSYACERRKWAIAKLLLDSGADPKTAGPMGSTPFSVIVKASSRKFPKNEKDLEDLRNFLHEYSKLHDQLV